jgi:hypothetical protein
MNNKKSGLTYDTAGESAAQIIRDYPNSTYGVYWIKPRGQTIAYQCYCLFDYLGNDWFSVSGLSASGVRGDVNGNNSGLAGLRLYGENIEYATLGGAGGAGAGPGGVPNLTNASGLNFTLPRDWINACNPRGLRVTSATQDMTALFNRSGNYVTIPDIWSYYYAMNNYNDIPLANGRRDTNATVSSWLSTNVTIYNKLVPVGVGALWSGNHHCGWSDGNHMLHGSTNTGFPGSYPGFCLDGTCWNESGIVWLAGT